MIVVRITQNFTLACIGMFTNWFLSNLAWRWTSLNGIVWYHFEWPWPSFNVTVVWASKNFCANFLAIFFSWLGWNLISWHDTGLLKAHTERISQDSKSRERTLLHFFFVLHSKHWLAFGGYEMEWICFKFVVMTDATELYSLVPVWMTLTFTQGLRATRKLELVKPFCCRKA